MNAYRFITRNVRPKISSNRLIRLEHSNVMRLRLLNTTAKHRNIPSTISGKMELEAAPLNFRTICILTGLSITGFSLFFLKENLLFGTVAGITAKTCTAPLERLTTHRQASIDTKYSISSVIREIYLEEGTLGFWRGNGINVFRASIQKGSLFALNDFFRSLLMTNMSDYKSMEYKQDKYISESPMISFISGSLAGLTSTLITYPLDPVKTVNQATIHKQKWAAMSIWYSLSQSRGYLYGPWIAGLPTFVGTSIYYGLKFMTFDGCIKRINLMSDRYDIEIPTDLRNVTAGLFSGIIGNSITYPNNCVRKRMQTAHVCNAIGIDSRYIAEKYANTALRLYNEGGIARLYRGFFINLLRNAPNTAIQFAVYKRLQIIWNQS